MESSYPRWVPEEVISWHDRYLNEHPNLTTDIKSKVDKLLTDERMEEVYNSIREGYSFPIECKDSNELKTETIPLICAGFEVVLDAEVEFDQYKRYRILIDKWSCVKDAKKVLINMLQIGVSPYIIDVLEGLKKVEERCKYLEEEYKKSPISLVYIESADQKVPEYNHHSRKVNILIYCQRKLAEFLFTIGNPRLRPYQEIATIIDVIFGCNLDPQQVRKNIDYIYLASGIRKRGRMKKENSRSEI